MSTADFKNFTECCQTTVSVSYTHLDVYKRQVTHRAGLGLGQGDLMFFPEGGNISSEQLIHNVRYLKPCLLYTSRCV